jgi:hypothetical protein
MLQNASISKKIFIFVIYLAAVFILLMIFYQNLNRDKKINPNSNNQGKLSGKEYIVSKTPVVDSAGKNYVLEVYSPDAFRKIAGFNDMWALVNEGDVLYDGDFWLKLLNSSGENPVRDSVYLSNQEYDASKERIYMIRSNEIGQPDIIAVETSGASTGMTAEFYYPHNGKLRRILFPSGKKDVYDTLTYSRRLRVTGKNRFQVAHFINSELGGYAFSDHILKPDKGKMWAAGAKEYFDEKIPKGEKLMEKWDKDSQFWVK